VSNAAAHHGNVAGASIETQGYMTVKLQPTVRL
jgi:hypothetical protein